MKTCEKYVKLLSYGPCIALIGSLLIGSPQCLAHDAQSSPSEPLRLTVVPRTSSRIAMKTLPKAVCVLHADGDSDTSRSFKLFSDDGGMIRFNVNPSEESEEAAAFAVDCTSEGQSRTFGLELRPNHAPSLDMPAPVAEIRAPKTTDIIRPALTKEEALQLSDEELIKREYPVRPKAKEAPDAFATWLQAVTKPARRVDARQVATEIRASSNWELESNWSGFELRNPIQSGIYDLVEGVWYVPTSLAKYLPSPGAEYSSFWVGLDGDGPAAQDLWQAGTNQDVIQVPYCGLSGLCLMWNFETYNAFTEYLPPQQNAQVLANFNVSAGDEMLTLVWVGNPDETPALLYPSGAPLFAIAFVEDITQNEYTFVDTCLGEMIDKTCTRQDGDYILGMEAEWIMERPCLGSGVNNCTYSDLADYDSAMMYDAYALQTNGQFMNYNGANNQDIWMYNSSTGHLLSAPFVYNNSTIEYIWYNYQ